jgi:hypothetical protein
MLTIPGHWAASCVTEPQLPFLRLPEVSTSLQDPVQLAEQLAALLPVLNCDVVVPVSSGRPFVCLNGGLPLGPLSIVALWGSGLWGEVDGSDQACFILPYRGSGHFRQAGRSLSNLAGRTLLYLPPEPWRTRNDAMGGITIRLDPALIRQVARTMAGPLVPPERWIDLGRYPLMLPVHQVPNGDLQFQRLYRLMAFIDGLLLSHGSLAASLRLDDLLLRQLVQLLAPGMLAESADRLERGTDAIDELLDWIHAHCHQPISLSELEQRSHYSRRSLQYAFKARFGCGPMQYLRRE